MLISKVEGWRLKGRPSVWWLDSMKLAISEKQAWKWMNYANGWCVNVKNNSDSVEKKKPAVQYYSS